MITGDVGPARQRTLGTVADRVAGLIRGDTVVRLAVDGVDGAGKTVLADELAGVLGERGITTVRASVDGFHHAAAVRYQRGRDSPEGFFHDSYDYLALARLLLRPLDPGGDRRIVRAVYDVRAERPVPPVYEVAPAPGVLIVDGIFLHRPELRVHWHYSVFLHVDFAVSIPRCAQRGDGDPDPDAASNRRYVEGQRLYLRTCRPRDHASVVIDNSRLAEPVILATR